MSGIAGALSVCATLLMLTGCSSGFAGTEPSAPSAAPGAAAAPAPASAAPVTPVSAACSLVTEQEAATALGADPGAGTESVDGSNSSCKFGNYPTLLTVNLVSVTGKADFEHLKSQDTGGAIAPVTGLGDAAFAVTEGPAASIWFTHGTAMVAIVLVLGSGSDPSDPALAIAHAADGRL